MRKDIFSKETKSKLTTKSRRAGIPRRAGLLVAVFIFALSAALGGMSASPRLNVLGERLDNAQAPVAQAASSYAATALADWKALMGGSATTVKFDLAGDWIADGNFGTTSNATGISRYRLYVPANYKVTLDLKGHTLSRGCTASTSYGSVFQVEGELIIDDSVGGGIITGGWTSTSGCGGAATLVDGAKLTLNGGIITGNKSSYSNTASGVVAPAGSTFTMNGGKITAGQYGSDSSSYGGVYVYGGTFNMNGGEISDNIASVRGGGVTVTASGKFNMTDGKITGNASNGSSGGAVWADSGTITMSGGEISGNRVESASNYSAGGMRLQGCDFTLSGGLISKNKQLTSTNSYSAGGLTLESATFKMTGGTISENENASNIRSGGAIFTNCGLTMQGGRIIGNKATTGGQTNVGYQTAGGIYQTDGRLEITGGEISGNEGEFAGGIRTFVSTYWAGNPVCYGNYTIDGAPSDVNTNNDVNLKLNIFKKLTAGAKIGIEGNTSWFSNLGYFTEGYRTYNKLEDPAQYFIASNPKKYAVIPYKYSATSYEVTMESRVSDMNWIRACGMSGERTVKLYDDWIADKDGRFGTGTGFGSTGGLDTGSNDGLFTLDLNGHTIDRNLTGKTEVSNGHVIYAHCNFRIIDSSGTGKGTITGGNSTNYSGGIRNGDRLIVEDVTICNNRTTSYGGGIYSTNQLTIKNVTIKNNYSGSYGGGIAMSSGAAMTIEGNTLIAENSALYYGGGISSSMTSSGGVLTIGAGVRIIDNTVRNEDTSTVYGGGIYLTYTHLRMTEVVVSGNRISGTGTGNSYGAGISIPNGSGSAIITNCTVSNNTGVQYGGGISSNGCDTQIIGGTITNNSATVNGGGLWNTSGVLTLKNVSITENTAANFGGGIYHITGEHTWDGNTITGNTSANNGGGIYTRDSTLHLSNNTIERNGAANYGGGIAMYAGNITFNSGTIAANTANDGAGIYRGVDASGVGTLTIKGGSIVNNVARVSAGGIGTSKTAKLYVGGNPNISGNTAAGNPCDVQPFNATDRIALVAKLTNTVRIGIYREQLNIFTEGFPVFNSGANPADFFVAQFTDRFVRLDSASGEGAIALDDPGDLWRVAVTDSINTGKQTTVFLKKDWTAPAHSSYVTAFGTDSTSFSNGALYVPAGANVVLDLNGKTVSRNLTAKKSYGLVVYINGGTFTLIDSSAEKTGKITGGYNEYSSGSYGFVTPSGAGGVVVNGGTFNMEGGTITGNRAEGNNTYSTGGVYMQYGTFRMTGGAIIGNTGQSVGGFYCYYANPSMIYMGGDVRIESNTSTNALSHDYKFKPNDGENKINVIAPFSPKARIGIYFESNNYKKSDGGGINTNYSMITADYSAKGNTADPVTVFFSNSDRYRVISDTQNGKTEAKMLSLDAYKNWADLCNNTEDGVAYTFPLYEDWTASYHSSYTTSFSSTGMKEGGIFVVVGRNVTIDLNGYTIDRGLTSARANGFVFYVEGTLTIVDSSDNRTGKITGGNNTAGGGGFYVRPSGKLILLGGKVTGNFAQSGAGVYVQKETSYLGYGRYAWITGNKSTTGAASNIFFATANFLYIEEDLWNKPTGITTPGNGTITAGFADLNGGNPTQYFYSENPDFYGVKGGDGELFFLSMNNDTNWQYAVDTSRNNDGRWETVVLAGNWDANVTSSTMSSFGTTSAYTAGELFVPSNAKIILDLAGFTLNRAMPAAGGKGGVIYVEGQLTIMDSSNEGTGKITGGNNSTTAYGAITVASGAIVVMNGGSVTGNKTPKNINAGSGVTIQAGGTFTLRDASVVNNEGGTAGIRVVYNASDRTGGVFNVAGKAVVEGNIRTYGVTNPTPRDTYFENPMGKINVVGRMTAGAHVGIQRDINNYISDNGAVVTVSYGRYNTEPAATYFFASDDPAHKIINGKGSNNSLEAALFCYNNMMNWSNAVAQSTADGAEKTVTLYSNWIAVNHDSYGTAFVTPYGTIPAVGTSSGSLFVPSNVKIKLDLNGFTIDRDIQRLAAVYDYGMVIRVIGYLHIVDSVGSGVITGGRVKGTNLNDISFGAGIHVQDNSELVLEGGTVTRNQGVGVYVGTTGKFGLGGKTVIKDNKFEFKDSAPNYDIFLLTITQGIEIVSKLTGGEMFGVTRTRPSDTKIANGVLTKNYGLYNDTLPTEVFYFGDKPKADGSSVDARYFVVDQGEEGDPDTEAALLSNDPAQNWEYAIKTSETYGKTMTVNLREDWIANPNSTGFGVARGFMSGSLYVPSDAKIILNLNGHTIDRNLFNSAVVANVFYIRGELTIIDPKGGGVIKGGNGGTVNSSWVGGGISIFSGSVTMTGGTLTGNKTMYNGRGAGGVYVDGGATFTMTGGTITGNYGVLHAGVYANLSATVNLGGSARIYDNFLTNAAGNSLGTQSNLYMYQDMETFNIVEPFVTSTGRAATKAIGLTADVKLLNATGNCYSDGWTKAMGGRAPGEVFFSDQPDDYVVISYPNNGVVEAGLYSIDNEANWASAVRNSLDTGETQTFRLYANWVAKPQYGYAYPVFGTKIGFTGGVIYVPRGASIILDLNGFDIDRNLAGKAAYAMGMVFYVDGELTIIDSTAHMEGGDIVQGKITGGNSTDYGGGVYMRYSDSKLHLLGGTFTENSAARAGAIYLLNENTFTMGGTAQFYNNYSFENGKRHSDIEARYNNLIEITDTMVFSSDPEKNKIYYSRIKDILGNITSGWGEYNENVDPADHFVAENRDDFWVASIGKGKSREAVYLRNRNQDNWEYAINKSLELGIAMPFKLVSDWDAIDIGEGSYYNTRFGNKANAYYYGALFVPEAASIVVDLNGYSLNRNHKVSYDSRYPHYNSVIIVEGNLQIIDTSADGSGKIKGGSYGVWLRAVRDAGSNKIIGGGTVAIGKAVAAAGYDDPDMEYDTVGGGTIAANSLYGIYVEAGTLSMTAGNVTENTYYDVYLAEAGTLNLGGTARILTENRAKGNSLRIVHNLEVLNIIAPFENGAEIGYFRESVGVLTDGWGSMNPNRDPKGVLKSEEANDYELTLKGEGSAQEVYVISFNNVVNWQYAVSKSLEQNGATQRFDMSKCWNADVGSFGTTSAFLGGALYVPVGASVILNLNGHKLDRNLKTARVNGFVIRVDGELIIIDEQLPEDGINFQETDCCEKINGFRPGGLITGGYNATGSSAGGIHVSANAKCTVKAGKIMSNQGNSGSASAGAIYNAGTLTITGGEIASNHGKNAGAIYNVGTATVAAENGEGVIINNNTAAEAVSAGGVYNAGNFLFESGTMNRNSGGAGGVYVAAGGRFTMGNENGATADKPAPELNENTAISGAGGVFVSGGSYFTLNGGDVKKNTGVFSGGIYTAGTTAIRGGSICENTATSNLTKADTAGGAGGVFVAGGGNLTMTAGEIAYNTGFAGVRIHASGALALGGAAQIYSNTTQDSNMITNEFNHLDVYFNAPTKRLNVVSTFDENANIGIYREQSGIFTSNYGYRNTELPKLYFHSNNTTYTAVSKAVADQDIYSEAFVGIPIPQEPEVVLADEKAPKYNGRFQDIIIKYNEAYVTAVLNGNGMQIVDAADGTKSIQAKTAGSYSVRFTPTGEYCWSNGTTGTTTIYASISPKPVELVWSDTDAQHSGECVYDGTTQHKPTASVKAADLEGTDVCTVTVIEGGQIIAGMHTACAVSLNNANYTVGENATYEYTVQKANRTNFQVDTVSVPFKNRTQIKVSGNSESGTLTYAIAADSAAEGEFDAAGTGLLYAKEFAVNPKKYVKVEVTAGETANYFATTVTKEIEVTKSELVAVLETTEVQYGDQLQLQIKDYVAAEMGTPTFDFKDAAAAEFANLTSAGLLTAKKVGKVTVVVYIAETDFYIETSFAAEITIVPRVLSLDWGDTLSATYDGNPHAPSFTVVNTGILPGDTADVTAWAAGVSGWETAKNKAEWTNAGRYTIGMLIDNPNYGLATDADYYPIFVIEKAAIELEILPDEIFYGLPVTLSVSGNDGNGRVGYIITGSGFTQTAYNKFTPDTVGASVSVTVDVAETQNYFGATTSKVYLIKAASLELSFETLEVTYGETLNLVVTGNIPNAPITLTNFGGTDGGSADLNAAAMTLKGTHVGKVKIEIHADAVSPYVASDCEVEITVVPRPVTVTWSNVGPFTYDKVTEWKPAASVAAESGQVINGDTLGNISARAGTKDEDGNFAACASNEVGTYFAQAIFENPNYVGAPLQEFTVKPFTVVLEWQKNAEFTYNGEEQVPTAEVANLFAGDAKEDCIVTVKGTKNAGVGLVAMAVELSNPNYTLEGCTTLIGTYTINPKPVGITWGETVLTYTGFPQAPEAIVNAEGPDALVPGDTCSVMVLGAQTNAGTGYVATAYAPANPNYVLKEGNFTTTFSIQRADIETELAEKTAMYGTVYELILTNNPERAQISYCLLAGADFMVAGTSGTRLNPVNVGKVTVEVTVGETENYNGRTFTEEITVLPRPVSINWSNLEFEYDKRTHNPIATLANAVNGDLVDLTLSEPQVVANTYTASVTKISDKRYTIEDGQNIDTEFTIKQKAVTIAWGNTELAYNGQVQHPAVTLGNIIDGDSCEPEVDGSVNAGVRLTATVKSLTNPNYTLEGVLNTSIRYNIAQTKAVLRWGETVFPYTGELQGPTATVTNLWGNDECEVTVSGKETEVGTYTATATALSNPNYTLEEVTNTEIQFTITKAPMELALSQTSVQYGEEMPVIVLGIPENSNTTITLINGTGKASLSAAKDVLTAEKAGEVTLRVTVPESANYEAGNSDIIVTITPRPIEVEWTYAEDGYVYNGTEQKPEAKVVNLLGTDICGVDVQGSTNAGNAAEAKVTSVTNSNYTQENGVNVATTFAIAPRFLEIEWVDEGVPQFEFNGLQQGPKAKIKAAAPDSWDSGLIAGDTAEILYSGWNVNVGYYTAAAVGFGNTNYVLDGNPEDLQKVYEIIPVKPEITLYPKEAQIGLPCTLYVDGNIGNGEVTYTIVSGANLAQIWGNQLVAYKVGTITVKAVVGETLNTESAEATADITIIKGGAPLELVRDKVAYGATLDLELDDNNGLLTDEQGKSLLGAITYTLAEGYEGQARIVGNKFTALKAGIVKINIHMDGTSNFDPTDAEAEIEVTPRTVTLDWTVADKYIYNKKPQGPTASVNNLVFDADVVEVTIEWATDAGNRTATAVSLSNDNYTLDRAEGTTKEYVISPKLLDLTWGAIKVTFNGQEQVPEAILSVIEDGDECEAVFENTFRNAGRYDAKVTGVTNSNYYLSGQYTTPFEIERAELAPTLKPETVAFGESAELVVEGNYDNGAVAYEILRSGVDGDGEVTEADGKTTFNATRIGQVAIKVTIAETENTFAYEGTHYITVNRAPRTLEFISDTMVTAGNDLTLKISGNEDEPGEVEYTVLRTSGWHGLANASVATVSGGVLHAKHVGSVTMRVTVKETANFAQTVIDEVTITIIQRIVEIAWGETVLQYNGKAQMPTYDFAEKGNMDSNYSLLATGLQTDVGVGYPAEVTGVRTTIGAYLSSIGCTVSEYLVQRGYEFWSTIAGDDAYRHPITGDVEFVSSVTARTIVHPDYAEGGGINVTTAFEIERGRLDLEILTTHARVEELVELEVSGANDNTVIFSVTNGTGTAILQEDGVHMLPKTVGTVLVTASVEESENYYAASVTGLVIIEKSLPKITLANDTVEYGGDLILSVNGNLENGAVTFAAANDSGAGILSGTLLHTTRAGIVKITVTVAETENYAQFMEVFDVTVTPRRVQLRWNKFEFTYNGIDDFAPTATAGGLINGDVCTVDVDGRQMNAGSYPAGTAKAIGLSNPNYTLDGVDCDAPSFVVNKAKIEIGLATTAITLGVPTKILVNGNKGNGDIVVTVENGTGTATASGDIVTGTQLGQITVNVTVQESENYLSATCSGTVLVEKPAVPVDLEVKTLMYGDTLTLSVADNLENGAVRFEVTNDTGSATLAGSNLTATGVGEVVVTVIVAETATYKLTRKDVTVTITKRIVEIAWQYPDLIYDGTVKTPTAVVGNLVEGDSCGVEVGADDGVGIHAGAGHRAYVIGIEDTEKYQLPEEGIETTYEILPRPVSLSWIVAEEYVYNGKEQAPTATVGNAVGEDKVTVTVKGVIDAGADVEAEATETDNEDYTVENGIDIKQAFTIKPYEVDVVWEGMPRVTYTGKPVAPTVYAVGTLNGDVCEALIEGYSTAVNARTAPYTATVTGVTNPNYTLKEEKFIEYYIDPVKLTMESDGWTKEYNGEGQTPTITLNGVVEGEEITLRAIDENLMDTFIEVGTYPLTLTVMGDTADNYSLEEIGTTKDFVVTKKKVTVKVVAKNVSVPYNGGNAVALPTEWYALVADGFLNGEDIESVFGDLSAFIAVKFRTADNVEMSQVTERGEYALVPVIGRGTMPESTYYIAVFDEEVTEGVLTVGAKDYVTLTTESTYRFMFEELDEEYGGVYRTTYEEKNFTHGVDDTAFERSVLGEIAPNTTINAFLLNFADNSKLTLYDHLGNIVVENGALYGDFQEKGDSDEVFVGTGWRMENGENGSYDIVYLSVLGDVDGDGKITRDGDVEVLIAYNRMQITFTVEFRLAARVNNGGCIGAGDVSAILCVISEHNPTKIEDFYYNPAL